MKTKTIHIRVDEKLLDGINKLAEQDRRKKTEVITIALENYLSLRKVI